MLSVFNVRHSVDDTKKQQNVIWAVSSLFFLSRIQFLQKKYGLPIAKFLLSLTLFTVCIQYSLPNSLYQLKTDALWHMRLNLEEGRGYRFARPYRGPLDGPYRHPCKYLNLLLFILSAPTYLVYWDLLSGLTLSILLKTGP